MGRRNRRNLKDIKIKDLSPIAKILVRESQFGFKSENGVLELQLLEMPPRYYPEVPFMPSWISMDENVPWVQLYHNLEPNG